MSEIERFKWVQHLSDIASTKTSEEDKILDILNFVCGVINQFKDEFKVLMPIQQGHYLYKLVTKDESKIILAMGWNGTYYIINSNEKGFIVQPYNMITVLYDKLKINSLFSENGIKHKNNTIQINFGHFVQNCVEIDTTCVITMRENTTVDITVEEYLQCVKKLQEKHLQELRELQEKHLRELRELQEKK